MLYFAPWKKVTIIILCVLGMLAVLPNFLSRAQLADLPDWVPARQLVLGLDLQGGSHLLLAVDTDAIVAERLESLRGDVRQRLREARIGYVGLGIQGDSVQVRIRELDRMADARAALADLMQPVAGNLLTGMGVGGGATEVDLDQRNEGQLVLTLTQEGIDSRVNSAVEQSIEVVRRRIDALGTTEPTIQRQGRERILVQVPGLDDPERLKALLGSTAKLSFQMVDTTMSAEQALSSRPPPDSQVLYSIDDPPFSLSDRTARPGQRRGTCRCPDELRPAHRRTRRHLPLQFERRAPFRHGDAGKCRPAIRHHPRQRGDQRAGHPGADPRWHGPDLGPVHRRDGQ